MNVKRLKEIINKYPDDYTIFILDYEYGEYFTIDENSENHIIVCRKKKPKYIIKK